MNWKSDFSETSALSPFWFWLVLGTSPYLSPASGRFWAGSEMKGQTIASASAFHVNSAPCPKTATRLFLPHFNGCSTRCVTASSRARNSTEPHGRPVRV
jgi:hypothetical protein